MSDTSYLGASAGVEMLMGNNSELAKAYAEWVFLAPYHEWVAERVVEIPGPYHRKHETFELGKTFTERGHWDGKCCAKDHYKNGSHEYRDDRGNVISRSERAAVPDDKVCLREQAWRKYIRIRDAKR